MISDELLLGFAYQALNMAKVEHERGEFRALMAAAAGELPLRRMREFERLIETIAGPDWLNNSAAKAAVFDTVRLCIAVTTVDTFVFVTAANLFRPTDKMWAQPAAAQKRIMDGAHGMHHQAVKDGLMSIENVLTSIAQTAQRICTVMQKVGPKGEFLGTPDTLFCPAAQFDGTMKVFDAEVSA